MTNLVINGDKKLSLILIQVGNKIIHNVLLNNILGLNYSPKKNK